MREFNATLTIPHIKSIFPDSLLTLPQKNGTYKICKSYENIQTHWGIGRNLLSGIATNCHALKVFFQGALGGNILWMGSWSPLRFFWIIPHKGLDKIQMELQKSHRGICCFFNPIWDVYSGQSTEKRVS